MNTATIQRDITLDYSGVEAVNTICSNLIFSGRNIKRIVITSCEPNDGKTFVALQIAANMAQRGKRVLLIDTDMRLSVMTTQYDIQLSGRSMGLAHLLSGQCTLEEVLYRTNVPNMYLIPIGTDVQTPLALLSTPDFENLLNAVGDTFDLVILDAPPVGLVIDAAEIAKLCDGTVLVLEYNKTRRRALQEAQQQMQRTGTPILGCILNKVAPDRLGPGGYYHYHYGYGYGKKYSKEYRYNRYEREK